MVVLVGDDQPLYVAWALPSQTTLFSSGVICVDLAGILGGGAHGELRRWVGAELGEVWKGCPLPSHLGVWWSVVSSPGGSGAEPRPKTDLGVFWRPQNAHFCTYMTKSEGDNLQGRIYSQRGPVQKKMWGPLPFTCFPRKKLATFLVITVRVSAVSLLKTDDLFCSSLSLNQGSRPLFPYFRHAKNSPLLLWGPLFVGPLFGRTCWTCLNPPLLVSPTPIFRGGTCPPISHVLRPWIVCSDRIQTVKVKPSFAETRIHFHFVME